MCLKVKIIKSNDNDSTVIKPKIYTKNLIANQIFPKKLLSLVKVSEFKIFDKSNQENPALINPGDRVTFYKISKQEYQKYNE